MANGKNVIQVHREQHAARLRKMATAAIQAKLPASPYGIRVYNPLQTVVRVTISRNGRRICSMGVDPGTTLFFPVPEQGDYDIETVVTSQFTSLATGPYRELGTALWKKTDHEDVDEPAVPEPAPGVPQRRRSLSEMFHDLEEKEAR